MDILWHEYTDAGGEERPVTEASLTEKAAADRPANGCFAPRVAAPSVCFAIACIPLAAAPTISPCIRHWRRSKSLPPLGELSYQQPRGLI